MRSRTMRLEIERLVKKWGVRDSGALGRRTSRIPQRGNFSFYPTLFIASQEMFVKSEITGQKSVEGASRLVGSSTLDWPVVLPLTGGQDNFTISGANDIHSRR